MSDKARNIGVSHEVTTLKLLKVIRSFFEIFFKCIGNIFEIKNIYVNKKDAIYWDYLQVASIFSKKWTFLLDLFCI